MRKIKEVELTHPGAALCERLIKPSGASMTEVADALGVGRVQLSRIANGHAGISAEMSLRIARVFGGPEREYLQLQAEWDLAEAREVGAWRQARTPEPKRAQAP